MKIELEVDDTIKRVTRNSGSSGKIHVPKTWIDREVMVCLLPIKHGNGK